MTPRRIDWERVVSCLTLILAAATFWILVWAMLIFLPQ